MVECSACGGPVRDVRGVRESPSGLPRALVGLGGIRTATSEEALSACGARVAIYGSRKDHRHPEQHGTPHCDLDPSAHRTLLSPRPMSDIRWLAAAPPRLTSSVRLTRVIRPAFSRAAPMGAAAPAPVRDREHPGHPGGVAQAVVWATRAAPGDPAAQAAPPAPEAPPAPPAPADPEAMGGQAAGPM